MAGFDATFSAPKSLSVWWALSGDEGLAECHDVAVRAVVGCIERYGSTTRIRSDGRRLHPDSAGLDGGGVPPDHVSRLDDPQLHSHVVISSKVQTDDGRWLALDARTLKGYQRALGGMYQSVLRPNSPPGTGWRSVTIVKGQAEIAGVPTELLEQFSKRTAQVDAAFHGQAGRVLRPARAGTRPRRSAAPSAARPRADTRGHKSGHGVADCAPSGSTEAAAVGVTPDSFRDRIDSRRHASHRVGRADVGDRGGGGVVASGVRRGIASTCCSALCDTPAPNPASAVPDWAAVLERDVDRVLDTCVDLDPTGADSATPLAMGGRCGSSRSARHYTSDARARPGGAHLVVGDRRPTRPDRTLAPRSSADGSM